MYTSMIIKDFEGFKRGQAFDTYQEGHVYVYIRPELTEGEFIKVNKHDYFNHFHYIGDSLSLDFRILKEPKKVLWFTIQPPPPEDLPNSGMYFNFEKLNRKTLRSLQEKIYLPLLQVKGSVIDRFLYEDIKSMLERLETKLKPNFTEDPEEDKMKAEIIEDSARLLGLVISKVRKGAYKNEYK